MVLAGTTEATVIIDALLERNIDVVATVTTRLGKELLYERRGLHIYQGRLSLTNLNILILEEKPDGLIDASNPFAIDISKNALRISKQYNIPYLRYERKEIDIQGEDIIRVKSYEEAIQELLSYDGNVMLTIGSSKIEMFTKIPNYKKRVFLRILPDGKIISRCEKLGFNATNIIAIKGPFTEGLNIQLLKYCNASIVVMKESGNKGGTLEKIKAARSLGIPIIMIERNEFACESKIDNIEEVLRYIDELSKSARERCI